MSNEILTSLIVAIGGIIAAFVTVRVRRSKPRSEYIDTAFEIYEANAKRTEKENERLREENRHLVVKNNELMIENNRLRRRK